MSKPTIKLFGREPAFWVAVLQGTVLVAVAFGVDPDAGVVVSTLVVAAGGVVTAWTVRDTLLAALLALAQAVAGLVVYLGYDLTDQQIATTLGLISLVLGGWLRTQTSPAETPVSTRGRAWSAEPASGTTTTSGAARWLG